MYAHIGSRKVKSWYISGMNYVFSIYYVFIIMRKINSYEIHTFNTFIFERLYDFITSWGLFISLWKDNSEGVT